MLYNIARCDAWLGVMKNVKQQCYICCYIAYYKPQA